MSTPHQYQHPPEWYSQVAAEIGREYDAASEVSRRNLVGIADRPQQQTEGTRRVTLTRASEIQPRPVRWLWDGRMALGTLVLIGGREGIGKSIVSYDLAAKVTRGRLAGAYAGHPRSVIVAATEDSWEHTIIPRLMAAGADLDRVFRVDVSTADTVETSLSLPRDLAELERVIAEVDAALTILDPLLSRLDTKLDSHKDAEVRLALEPLVAVADRTASTVAGLIHVNKSTSSDPLTTLMASRAFAAVARSVLFVMQDPNDDKLRLLGQAKNNLGQMDLPTLAFRIEGVKVADTPEGEVWTGKLEWAGESTRSIREAIEEAAEAAGDRTATAEAMVWLQDFLEAHGGRVDSALAKGEGKAAGHSVSALQRARQRLKLITETSGFPRRTYWLQSSHAVVSPSGESETTEMNETTGTTEGQSFQSFQSFQSLQTPQDVKPQEAPDARI